MNIVIVHQFRVAGLCPHVTCDIHNAMQDKRVIILGGAILIASVACSDESREPDAGSLDDASMTADAMMTDANMNVDAVMVDAAMLPDAGPNTAPTITTIADLMTHFPAIGPISFTVGDAEMPPSSLVVTATSDNQVTVPDRNLSLAGTGADRTITVTPAANGTATITVTVDDSLDTAIETFVVTVVNSTPVGVADAYDWFGNTVLTTDSIAGVLSNDTDDNSDLLMAISVTNGATTLGGTYDLATDGGFTYRPPLGVTGTTDGFMYEVTDGFHVGIGVVTIALTDMVWYVDNTAAADGDGRSFSPFDTLAAAATSAAPGDTIYVFEGDGTSTGQSDGIVLQNGQRLIGAGIDFVLGGTTVWTAGNSPVITNTNGDGVSFDGTATVRGLTILSPSDMGIFGDSVTGATIRDVTVRETGTNAIYLRNLDIATTAVIEIRDTTLRGNGMNFASTSRGVRLYFGGNSGGNIDAHIRDNQIFSVIEGINIRLSETIGTGASGTNIITVADNQITDFRDTAINSQPYDGTNTALLFTNNTIDQSVNIAPVSGSSVAAIRMFYQTSAMGNVDYTMIGNSIFDSTRYGIYITGTNPENNGTLTGLIENNTITNSVSESLIISLNNDTVMNATVTGNTMTNNGGPTTFTFGTGTLDVMTLNLNLLNNEDDEGFYLERDTEGIFRLAGALGQGMSFDDDNGNIAGNGNTTGGGSPAVVIGGGGHRIHIVDPATVALP